jgi:hypothetical protein
MYGLITECFMFQLMVKIQCSMSYSLELCALNPWIGTICPFCVFDVRSGGVFFAIVDDIFVPTVGATRNDLINYLERSVETIGKWLRQFSLKFNESKTELYFFSRNNQLLFSVSFNKLLITSGYLINVLGIISDTNLTWSKHIRNAISKANKSLKAKKIIRRHFNTAELLQMLADAHKQFLFCTLLQH